MKSYRIIKLNKYDENKQSQLSLLHRIFKTMKASGLQVRV